jgi:hypothetical protein
LSPDQSKYLANLNQMQINASYAGIDYWQRYSFGTWQFWVNVAMLILPLVMLYFLIDRKKALLLGFFGFSVHILFTYIDSFGASFGLWNYPFKALPLLPVSFALDVSLVPVSFMLLYQWTLNNNKNYYVYFIGLSVVFAFIFKPIMTSLGLFQLNRWAHYYHLFLGYMIISVLSKWITNLFLHFLKEGERSSEDKEVNVKKRFSMREKAR